jgi:uncharacterized membrane protein
VSRPGAPAVTAPAMARPGRRAWEVDALRGVAIIMMVIYHLMWDLSAFDIAPVDLYGLFWQSFQRATASLFLLLVGVSLQLRALRLGAAGADRAALWRRQFRRGLAVFGCGLLVTAATLVAIPRGFVVFGILHLIGVSIILAYPFMALGRWNLPIGLAVIAAGNAVAGYVIDMPWLVWLGLRFPGFTSVDYFPLLPWFGVVLIGLAAGELAYGSGRRLPLPDLARLPPVRLLGWLGRHSLAIYLLHQPLLIAALIALGLLPLQRLGG